MAVLQTGGETVEVWVHRRLLQLYLPTTAHQEDSSGQEAGPGVGDMQQAAAAVRRPASAAAAVRRPLHVLQLQPAVRMTTAPHLSPRACSFNCSTAFI